ncbi:hypothetical protein LX36DRAFT_194580 [Colletotrichum falcatum]|nr:hypothetical protein LX36DRAFT_194580 [Colletotrichum falcatum]
MFKTASHGEAPICVYRSQDTVCRQHEATLIAGYLHYRYRSCVGDSTACLLAHAAKTAAAPFPCQAYLLLLLSTIVCPAAASSASSLTGGQVWLDMNFTIATLPFGAHLVAKTTSRPMTQGRQALPTLPWFWGPCVDWSETLPLDGSRYLHNLPALKAKASDSSSRATYTNYQRM